MQIDTEDRRLTPRERRIVREIAHNLDARKSGKNHLARPMSLVPPPVAEEGERVFGSAESKEAG